MKHVVPIGQETICDRRELFVSETDAASQIISGDHESTVQANRTVYFLSISIAIEVIASGEAARTIRRQRS